MPQENEYPFKDAPDETTEQVQEVTMRFLMLSLMAVLLAGCGASDNTAAPQETEPAGTSDPYPVRVLVTDSITPRCGAEVTLFGVAERFDCCVFGAKHRVGEGTGTFRWDNFFLSQSGCTFNGFVSQDVLLTTGPNCSDVIYEIQVFANSIVYTVSPYP